jgi:hypothetical protein
VVEDWNVQETAAFLRGKGLDSYGDYFEKQGYNGMMMLEVEHDDVKVMPEKDVIKRKVFKRLVERLKKDREN